MRSSRTPRSSAGLKGRVDRLESLIEAAKVLNSTFDLDSLLKLILHLATRNLNAARGTIYLIDHETKELWSKVLKGGGLVEIRLPLGTGIAGAVAKNGRSVNLRDVRKDKRFDASFDRKSGFRTRTMLCMPMKNRQGKRIGVFQIINKRSGFFTTEDEVFLAAFSEHAALAIENARLYQASIESERVAKELQIAAEIQQRLLPKDLHSVANYELASAAQPCKTIGGDLYDVVPLPDDRCLFTMADVSGKGIPAALLVSTLHASLRAYLQNLTDLRELVSRLNDHICANSPPEQFITFFVAILDLRTHTLTFVNAGHNSPLVLRKAIDEQVELKASGLPLGMMEGMPYEEQRVVLNPGDVMAMYTDGVTEAMDTAGEQYGLDRFLHVLRVGASLPVSEMRDKVLEDVRTFVGSEPPSDDLTLLFAKRLA
jgi:sigma-B regulation protein RsbU (phosphoserine phosphatase)